jgi:hypothetical protein
MEPTEKTVDVSDVKTSIRRIMQSKVVSDGGVVSGFRIAKKPILALEIYENVLQARLYFTTLT